MQAPLTNATTTYQPDKRTIGELLSMTTPAIIVPDWQRSYSWQQSQIETFWHDLTEFSERYPDDNLDGREYFFGSIVIVKTNHNQHLLLDGQQRIATSAILLSVIRDNLKVFKEEAAHRVQSRYLVDFDDSTNEWRYKITLNAYDREFYKQKVLAYRDSNFSEPTPTHASHKLISAARSFFEQKFTEEYNHLGSPEKSYSWALRIQRVLINHMSVISVVSSNEDSAAEVFETLNDRGVGLSTPDLLRNLVIRRAQTSNRSQIISLWEEIIRFDSDVDIKSFLRHYWISYHGDVKTQRLYREIKTQIQNSSTDSLTFTQDLGKAAEAYRQILKAEDADPNFETLLQEFSEVGANALMPIVLSISQSAPSPKKVELLRLIIAIYMRHSIIGQLENSKLENVIHPIAKKIREGRNIDALEEELRTFAPNDESFEESFARAVIGRTSIQRYILRKLENSMRRTGELQIGPNSKVHVEHIYPQKPFSRFDNHDQILNRLGNLTLLDARLNSTIKNGSFEDKKPSFARSELMLTKSLCDHNAWTADAIAKRQKELAKLAVTAWPVALPVATGRRKR